MADEPQQDGLSSLLEGLTDIQRRFAEAVAGDPTLEMWRAGQVSGCLDQDPRADLTGEEHKEMRRQLSKRASELRRKPKVAKYIDYLTGVALARAGKLNHELAERLRDRTASTISVIDARSLAIDVSASITGFELAEIAIWDGTNLEVLPTEKWSKDARRAVIGIKQVRCPQCGCADAGVEIKAEPKATHIRQLAQLHGVLGPTKVELAGANGGPIQVSAASGPAGLTRETILACRMAIVGRPVPRALAS